MVILGDIFDLLANSEVLNTKLSRSPNGALDESEYVKVVGHLNLGLVELYKRFNLRQRGFLCWKIWMSPRTSKRSPGVSLISESSRLLRSEPKTMLSCL